MYSAFVRFGHGYESGSQGRCTAFDDFKVIAAPLPGTDEAGRARRVFNWHDGRRETGCTYAPYTLKLAKSAAPGLFILMQHGGGREVLRVPDFFDGGDLERHILAMPERLQFALLHTIWKTASNARQEAQQQTAVEWATAYREKRLKLHRASKGRGPRVEIVQAAAQ